LAIRAIRFLSLEMVREGQIYLELKRPARAEALFRQSAHLSQEANSYLWVPRFQVGIAMARLQQGDHQVGPLLKETLAMARLRGQQLYLPICYEGLAELALAQGAYAEAQQYADSMLSSAEQSGQREKIVIAYWLRGASRLAAAASVGGLLQTATQDLHEAHRLAQELETPYLLWRSHQALAQLYQLQGDKAQADAHTTARQTIIQSIVDNLQDDELTRGLVA